MVSERDTGKELTASDVYMGTPDYNAPEQATDARSADIRADLYSLGCTLYCLLAGRPPFQEDTAMKTILAHHEMQPQSLPELRPEVPERLWRVVARLLAKEPEQRYQKPIEVAQRLVSFVNSEEKPEAKRNSVTVVGSPGKITAIAADTPQIKKVLREGPGKASSKEAPARWYRRWPVLAGVGRLLLTLLVMWACGVFKVVVLKVDQADAEVSVDGQKISVQVPGDNKPIEIKVEPGRSHKLPQEWWK